MPDSITPRCIVCGQPMHLLDEEEERWYCHTDDVLFFAKKNTWKPEATQEQLAETKRLTEEKPEEKRSTSPMKTLKNYILIGLSIFLATNIVGLIGWYHVMQGFDQTPCKSLDYPLSRLFCDAVYSKAESELNTRIVFTIFSILIIIIIAISRMSSGPKKRPQAAGESVVGAKKETT